MRRRAVLLPAIPAAVLLGFAFYLVVLAQYGPAGSCRGAFLSTFDSGTRASQFMVLRCSDHAGDAHRLIAAAVLPTLLAIGLLRWSWRTACRPGTSAHGPLSAR